MGLQPLRVWKPVHLDLHIALHDAVPDTRDIAFQCLAADGGEGEGGAGINGGEEVRAFVEAAADRGDGFGK